jgi:DNA-binding transcriptional MerR regulator
MLRRACRHNRKLNQILASLVRHPMIRTYSINEFTKVTGISAFTLRYFDKIGLLSPERQHNGYRVYSLKQVSIAELILLLQKARIGNANIKQLLQHYDSENTVQQLQDNRQTILQEIADLQYSLLRLDQHIDKLTHINHVKTRLFQPTIEHIARREYGLIDINARDIVDLFDYGDTIIGNVTWPHVERHGLVVRLDEINTDQYPVKRMYVDNPDLREHQAVDFIEGDYFSFYANGSMENNPSVSRCIEQAQQFGTIIDDYLIIEQVSGPVMEVEKNDFLVKIMVRIAGYTTVN